MAIRLPDPELQANFAQALMVWRERLQPALFTAVGQLGVEAVDAEINALVPPDCRTLMAAHGLRAELVFPAPVLLTHNPCLLGYYRLLMGYSQKLFYTAQTGASAFSVMEAEGTMTERCRDGLRELCMELCRSGATLLRRLDTTALTPAFLHELTILTLGAQLRGGANNRIGKEGVAQVFEVIRSLVARHIKTEDKRKLELLNASKRAVLIEFASDPDIVIQERMSNQEMRNIIAIEIKGGRDYSNIHNRVGEAEKSHQKAKNNKFAECWTIINIDRFDHNDLKRESPTTDRFYSLQAIASGKGAEFTDFRSRILSLTGIPARR